MTRRGGCRRFGRAMRRVRLWRDRSGAAIVEMAIIVPVFMLMIIGTMELSLNLFIGAAIEQSVVEASRFGITGATGSGVSRIEQVRSIIEKNTYGLINMDEVEIETLVYRGFEDIGEPEPYTDSNDNGSYDEGEPYTDINGNGQWDADMGEAGLGGGDDIVLYRVTYRWGFITPMIQEVLGREATHVSAIAVRNEPF